MVTYSQKNGAKSESVVSEKLADLTNSPCLAKTLPVHLSEVLDKNVQYRICVQGPVAAMSEGNRVADEAKTHITRIAHQHFLLSRTRADKGCAMSENIKPQTIAVEVEHTASNNQRSHDNMLTLKVPIKSELRSLKTESEEIKRKVPRKPRRYPMSATAKEMKELLPKKVIQVGEKITWLTTEAASLYIGISPAAMRQMVQRKQVVAYKPFGGRKLYFKKSDLDQAIESSKKVGGRKWQ